MVGACVVGGGGTCCMIREKNWVNTSHIMCIQLGGTEYHVPK